jgi:hypothetical protein
MPRSAARRQRSSARLPVALLIVGALLLSGAACDGGGDHTENPPTPTMAGPTVPTLTCGRSAPDGSTIDVVEGGFSTVNEPPSPDVTYGVVLENTSTAYLAILTLVVVRLTDAHGNRANDTVRTPLSDPAQAVQTIFPGQRIGIGDQVYLDRQGIEEMTVEVGESAWMPVEQMRDVGVATATDLDFEWIGSAARIGFQVVPTADPRQNVTSSESIGDAQSWAIFRDEDGTIVGGGAGSPGTSWNGLNDSYPITENVQVSRVPDRTVDASTEIFVSPLYPPYNLSNPRPC